MQVDNGTREAVTGVEVAVIKLLKALIRVHACTPIGHNISLGMAITLRNSLHVNVRRDESLFVRLPLPGPLPRR